MIFVKVFTCSTLLLILANAEEIKIKNDTKSAVDDPELLSAEKPSKLRKIMDNMKNVFRGKKMDPISEDPTEPPDIDHIKIPTNLFTRHHERYTRKGYTFITPERTSRPTRPPLGFFKQMWGGVTRVARNMKNVFKRKPRLRPHTYTVIYPERRNYTFYRNERDRTMTPEPPDPNEGWDDDLFKNIRGKYKGRYTTGRFGPTDLIILTNTSTRTYKPISPEEMEKLLGPKKTKKPMKEKPLSKKEQRRKELQALLDY